MGAGVVRADFQRVFVRGSEGSRASPGTHLWLASLVWLRPALAACLPHRQGRFALLRKGIPRAAPRSSGLGIPPLTAGPLATVWSRCAGIWRCRDPQAGRSRGRWLLWCRHGSPGGHGGLTGQPICWGFRECDGAAGVGPRRGNAGAVVAARCPRWSESWSPAVHPEDPSRSPLSARSSISSGWSVGGDEVPPPLRLAGRCHWWSGTLRSQGRGIP